MPFQGNFLCNSVINLHRYGDVNVLLFNICFCMVGGDWPLAIFVLRIIKVGMMESYLP